MSLYVSGISVIVSTLASAATFITHLFAPQYFTLAALVTAGSVLFGVLFLLSEYLWILYGTSYLK